MGRSPALMLSVGLLSITCHAAASDTPWKYDLQPGDHLLYQYTFERGYRGADGESHTRAMYTSHVVVLGAKADRISVGFQRNREAAELLEYKEHGRDRLAQELPKFHERMAKRRSHFSEAMEFSRAGEPLSYWEASRETPSKLMLAIHEIEALPAADLKAGDSWLGASLLGVRFKRMGQESVNGKMCNRADGSDAGGTIRVRYWWCQATGAIEKLEFEGEYAVPGGTVLEAARFQLKEKRRSERVGEWLASPEVRDGAMQALILSPWIEVAPSAIDPVLASGDSRSQSLALTWLVQRGIRADHAERIRELTESPDPTVKRLATKLVEPEVDPTPLNPSGCKTQERVFPAERVGTTVRLTGGGKTGSYPYMIRVPGDYRGDRKVPLLIYLSGGGGLAIDAVNTGEEAVAGTDYLVLYPQAGDYWWTAGSEERVDALLRQVLSELNVDTNRVYITGFSNGGTGAMDFAELWPQRFAAVVSLMGAGQCTPQVRAGLKNLTSLPILFVHGDRDPRIDVSCSRETFESLKALTPKTTPVLRVLGRREHDITLQQDDGLTLPFFAGRVREAWPAKFTAVWGDTRFPRRYWLELLEKGPAPAEVEAQVVAPNRIEIKARGVKRLRVLLRRGLVSDQSPVTVLVNKKKVFEGRFQADCKVLQESSAEAADPVLGYEQAVDFDAK